MKYLPFLLLFALIAAGCITNESEFKKIITLEYQRRPCEELLPMLQNSEPRIRRRAVEAFAKLQDTTCVDAIADLLDDVNHTVRIEAAFALGQIGSASAEQALLKRLNKKDVDEAKRRILEALGKVGGEDAFPTIAKQLLALEPTIRGEAALAIGRLAYRSITDSTLTEAVTLLLSDRNADVRWKAAYALMRIDNNLKPGALRKAAEDEDLRVRMYALAALGNIKNYTFIEPIARALDNDPDWRVRVNAAKAFAKYPLRLSANHLSVLNQPQPVRVAIIEAIGKSALLEPKRYQANSRELNFSRSQLEDILTAGNRHTKFNQAEKGAALLAYAHLMGTEALALTEQHLNVGNIRLRTHAIEALGEIGSKNAFKTLKEKYANSTHTAVKTAILEAIKKINGTNGTSIYLKALEENDAILIALGAQGLAGDSLKNKIHANKIVAAYQRFSKEMGTESTQMVFAAMAAFKEQKAIPVLEEALKSKEKPIVSAALNALQKITGKEVAASEHLSPQKLSENPDIAAVFTLSGTHAIISTDRGQIKIELLPEDAPLTVNNFVNLTKSAYYDSLTFHRVVPNFVIQGGDPRGDGWGSPGYAIRSEFNKNNYLRGAVGMASSGKDTEGSQFFITHSAQPHLDGRYTVFGRVVSGMDVVDAIQEGDIINKIRISK